MSQYPLLQLLGALQQDNFDRADFLRQKEKKAISEQPKLKQLRDKILKGGGTFVSFQWEYDLERLLLGGQFYPGKSKLILMETSRCHQNASVLWKENPGKYNIMTGYALNVDPDGISLWRQHSWLQDKKGNNIETTEKRDKYFGISLTDQEAEDFFESNSL
jgi:hypothetical protein